MGLNLLSVELNKNVRLTLQSCNFPRSILQKDILSFLSGRRFTLLRKIRLFMQGFSNVYTMCITYAMKVEISFFNQDVCQAVLQTMVLFLVPLYFWGWMKSFSEVCLFFFTKIRGKGFQANFHLFQNTPLGAPFFENFHVMHSSSQ